MGNECAHIYNNFYFGKGQKDNGDYLAQIIGGEGSEILSQNNMFEGFSKNQVLSIDTNTKNLQEMIILIFNRS